MFNLRTILTQKRVLDLQIIRNIKALKTDPGIRRRKNVLSSPAEEFIDEDLDDLEANFMDLHKTHKEYQKETEQMQERLKFQIIKQKYFKEKYPNFLTWSDKEQIKYLHNTNPDEWTIEKLSESFPALPEIIKKVVKARYSKNEHKASAHDSVVQKNWQDFKEGNLQHLPADLERHLKKFTHRSLNLKPLVSLEKQKVVANGKQPSAGSYFSEIITSYEKIKMAKNGSIAHEEEKSSSNFGIVEQDLYKRKNRNLVTLQQLQSSLEKKVNAGKYLDEDEKVLLENKKKETEQVPRLSQDLVIPTQIATTSSNVSLAKKSQKDYAHLMYPEKIKIPKNIYKKGNTYKLNDCFYDSDGWFLYRVPGMD